MDCFQIDDLLDFSNHHLTNTTSSDSDNHHFPPPQQNHHLFTQQFSHDPDFFTNFPSIHSDEAAELEWLSQFVDDTTSFNDLPPNHTTASQTTPFLTSSNNNKNPSVTGKSRIKGSSSPAAAIGEGGVRKCSHCASEKTPQWRTGPNGPKTLCNACGVRFKSGRLVPEYRPASSPTFVLTQHSNSHRKVMELRRQKELQSHHHFKLC